MDDKDIDFVSEHYKDDVFSPEAGWRKFRSILGLRRKRYGIAMAVAAIITVTATAAIISYQNRHNEPDAAESVGDMKSAPGLEETRILAFDHTKLTEVVEIVEAEYSVEIGNVPPNSDDFELTLRYEGTPTELIDAINEILGIQLTISEK